MPNSTQPSPRSRQDEPVHDREAAVEALLLAGLDHYFAGDHERAIHAWERVLFIDRTHARARAYINRARAILAEHQREADACLHDGIEAFRSGDDARARQLLTSVIEARGPDEQAVALLQRMDRRQPALELPRPALRVPRTDTVERTREPGRVLGRAQAWLLASTGVLLVVAAVVVMRWEWVERWWLGDIVQSEAAVVVPPSMPPLLRASELALVRARGLYGRGHLHEALRVLDDVRTDDPRFGEAERLRAEIQRTLLDALASTAPAVASRP